MRTDRGAAGALAGTLLLAVAACGSGDVPIRIGLLSDCEGIMSFVYEPTVAAGELPLIARGARPKGEQPSDGITVVRVGGRRVELVLGCAGTTSSSTIAEARRLVEREGVRILVGAQLTEGNALREYARARPGVTFLAGAVVPRSTTRRDPAPNFFDFYLDSTQASAGMGTYAYRQGWRRAALVSDDARTSWGFAAGVVREFCALGGKIAKRVWIPVDPSPRDLAVLRTVPRQGIDGIFYVSGGGQALSVLLGRLPLLRHGLDGKVVGSASPFVDPDSALGARRIGAVYSTGGTNTSASGPSGAYVARLAKAFPNIYSFTGLLAPANGFGLAYYNAMEAALRALERVSGDLSGAERGFQAALAHVEFDAPNGHLRLDQNRQVIAPNYLNRIERTAGGRLVTRTVLTIPAVDQTLGGLFPANSPPPGKPGPACERAKPPPWAR